MHLLVEVLRILLLLPTACVPLRTAAATTIHVAATTTTIAAATAAATSPALLAALLISPLAFKPLLLECLRVLHLLPPLGVDGIAQRLRCRKWRRVLLRRRRVLLRRRRVLLLRRRVLLLLRRRRRLLLRRRPACAVCTSTRESEHAQQL